MAASRAIFVFLQAQHLLSFFNFTIQTAFNYRYEQHIIFVQFA